MELQISFHPSITINNFTYHGDFDGQDIFQALCSSFKSADKPEQCGVLYDLSTNISQISDFLLPHHRNYWIKVGLVVFIVNICLFLFCWKVQKKKAKKRVKKEVEMQVARYFRMKEQKDLLFV